MKDHLGSIRAVIDEYTNCVSAQDYDMWGFFLENRTYNIDEAKYKFTGKERDIESSYDYFGARYYMSRIGRWGSEEPLLEKYISISPYSYAKNNPIVFKDVFGKDVRLSGEEYELTYKYLRDEFPNLKIKMDETGKLSATGEAKTLEELLLYAAINNPKIIVEFITAKKDMAEGQYFQVGCWGEIYEDEEGVTHAIQYINLGHAKLYRDVGGNNIGRSVMHEISEGYMRGFIKRYYGYQGKTDLKIYYEAHDFVESLDPFPKRFHPKTPIEMLEDRVTGQFFLIRAYMVDKDGNEHLNYDKETVVTE